MPVTTISIRWRALLRNAWQCRSTALQLLIPFLLIGCTSQSTEPRKLRFAFIPKALHIPVFAYAKTGAERAAQQLGGIEVIWRGAETTDEIRQKEILESFIAQRVDGIAI